VRSDQIVQTEYVQGWDINSFTNRHLQHLHMFLHRSNEIIYKHTWTCSNFTSVL